MRHATLILLFLAIVTAAPRGSSRDLLTVDTAAPRTAAPALGLNLNYLMDGTLTAPQLAATGARCAAPGARQGRRSD